MTEVMTEADQDRLDALMNMNTEGILTPPERSELAALVNKTHRLALAIAKTLVLT